MAEVVIRFGTPEPFGFKDRNFGETLFEARINGIASVSGYDTALYPSEDELVKAVRSKVGSIAEEELAGRPVDNIMSSKSSELLCEYLSEGFEKLGISAVFEIKNILLTEESAERYRNSMSGGMFEVALRTGMIPGKGAKQPGLEDLVPEEHGSVVKIVYGFSSFGMAMGSGVSVKKTVVWQEDGNVLIEETDRRYGKETYDLNIAGREAAVKLRDYVRESRAAEMGQVKPIPNPFRPTDYSSSSYITFTFDDSAINGKKGVERTLDCGSVWKIQEETVRRIHELMTECINTGKCLEHKETSYDPMKPDSRTEVTGMGMILGIGSWKCSCGTDNTGKYCENCGEPKPE